MCVTHDVCAPVDVCVFQSIRVTRLVSAPLRYASKSFRIRECIIHKILCASVDICVCQSIRAPRYVSAPLNICISFTQDTSSRYSVCVRATQAMCEATRCVSATQAVSVQDMSVRCALYMCATRDMRVLLHIYVRNSIYVFATYTFARHLRYGVDLSRHVCALICILTTRYAWVHASRDESVHHSRYM